MVDNFKPPIKTRTTEDLINIVAFPKKWNRDAVYLAKYELSNRNADTSAIDEAIRLAEEAEEMEKLKKANTSYRIFDFLFSPMRTLLQLTFNWNLKKNGYILKAQQQKTFRITLIIIILLVYFLKFIQENF